MRKSCIFNILHTFCIFIFVSSVTQTIGKLQQFQKLQLCILNHGFVLEENSFPSTFLSPHNLEEEKTVFFKSSSLHGADLVFAAGSAVSFKFTKTSRAGGGQL